MDTKKDDLEDCDKNTVVVIRIEKGVKEFESGITLEFGMDGHFYILSNSEPVDISELGAETLHLLADVSRGVIDWMTR
jgi:hypothetical protein